MDIYPLGDSALTIEFGDVIDEKINDRVVRAFNELKSSNIKGVYDLVPAYSSLSVYFDGTYDHVKEAVERMLAGRIDQKEFTTVRAPRHIKVPVCYDVEYGIDLEKLATEKGMTIGQLIEIHTSRSYRIYMLGFLPGFPYMGKVDERIAAARKDQPVQVQAGSVGIAGVQTGIYPMDSPGGWQIIGRTPLKIFNKEETPTCLFAPGDEISFFQINIDEFKSY